jgi:hypothetical protein
MLCIIALRLYSLTDMQNRHPQDFKPLHLIQLPVTDTPQDAEASVSDVLNLCNMVCNHKPLSMRDL